MKRIISILILLVLMTSCSFDKAEKPTVNKLPTEKAMLLDLMYVNELAQYLAYYKAFRKYAAMGDIDNMAIYDDSCKMSFYTLGVILKEKQP